MKTLRRILISLLILLPLSAAAQREVTPVESDDKKPRTPTLHYYDKHGNPLDEPVLFLATLDTVDTKKSSAAPVYPRLHALDFGVNFMDGILAIAGQKYGGADIWASLSMWNWLFPTVELGLAGAHNTPEGLNYTYKGSPAFYAKIGADYNFLYRAIRNTASCSACVPDSLHSPGRWPMSPSPTPTGGRPPASTSPARVPPPSMASSSPAYASTSGGVSRSDGPSAIGSCSHVPTARSPDPGMCPGSAPATTTSGPLYRSFTPSPWPIKNPRMLNNLTPNHFLSVFSLSFKK